MQLLVFFYTYLSIRKHIHCYLAHILFTFSFTPQILYDLCDLVPLR